ncbi:MULTISPECIES: hypothetical protein [unclassified Thiocapsa]|uniref:hypothetical protein n=1 Tax=unclassified Thiocapsa TaxID=2641286 RepID=UPI0035ADEFF3
MALDPKEKQKAYRDRMRAADMVPIHDWAPRESAELVHDICRKLRETKKAKKTK